MWRAGVQIEPSQAVQAQCTALTFRCRPGIWSPVTTASISKGHPAQWMHEQMLSAHVRCAGIVYGLYLTLTTLFIFNVSKDINLLTKKCGLADLNTTGGVLRSYCTSVSPWSPKQPQAHLLALLSPARLYTTDGLVPTATKEFSSSCL